MLERTPNHIAIIMDGNRRWATKKGLPAYEGHREGAKRTDEIAETAKDQNIPYLTVWAASIDNLTKRTKIEVDFLSSLFERELEKMISSKTLEKNSARFRVIGKGAEILGNKKLSELIHRAEENTKHFDTYHFTILFGYDGKSDMIEAIEKMRKGNATKPLSYETVKEHLSTSELPPVDLVIRTGGEPHWSGGFLMWHTTDSQFYFTETLWPDFGREEFKEAITDFSGRGKRLGK